MYFFRYNFNKDSNGNYNLNNVDSLIFKTNNNCFELFSRYEEFDEISIGKYEKGRWKFVDYKQQLIFFQLFGIYKNRPIVYG